MDTLILIALPIIAAVFIVVYGIWKTSNFKKKNTAIQYPFTPASLAPPAEELLVAINKYRAESSASYLLADSIASYLAQDRCYEMIDENILSHEDWGDEASEILVLGSDSIGENIAYGHASTEGVMEGWKKSEGHNENMLNPKWKYIGIAVVKDSKGRNWYCTLFLND